MLELALCTMLKSSGNKLNLCSGVTVMVEIPDGNFVSKKIFRQHDVYEAGIRSCKRHVYRRA